MQLKEFNIILDIKKNIKQEQFEVVQGDSFTNLVNISLVDGLNPYDLSNTNVEIVFSKSDGTTVQQTDIAIINDIQGRIQCILKTNTIASPGKTIAEVRVLNMDKLLTSTRFEFFVRKSLINDETIESTNEFPVLTQLITTTENLIDQISQIEKQVPENVVTQLNQVSVLANQLNTALTTHEAEIASKHIKESGSNANGSYIKFDDGTMICTHRMSISAVANTSITTKWVYPANFSSAVLAKCFTSVASFSDTNNYTINIINGVVYTIDQWRNITITASATQTYIIDLVGIGRWKA